MTKKSRFIGFVIITLIWVIFQIVMYMTVSREIWAYMLGYGVPVIGYLAVIILYALIVSIINLFKDIVKRSRLPIEQRVTGWEIIKKHSLMIFLIIIILIVYFLGKPDRGNQIHVGTPDDSWYSR